MRIIYLHQYFVTPDMAGGTRSYEMARRLVRAGNPVEMVTTDQRAGTGGSGWRVTLEDGVRVHWASVHYDSKMGYARRLVAFVVFAAKATIRASRLSGDLIFATSTPLTIAIPALLASRIKRIPFVFEVRDMWPDVPIAIGAIKNPVLVWLARRLELITYRRSAHIVALAPGMREDIIAKGIEASKVSVIPNGCDLDVFAEATDATEPRSEIPWLGDRKLVLFAGTLGAVNGVEYLVEVAHAMLERDPEVRFVVIGDGVRRDAVHDLAVRRGVMERNLFMLGAIPKRELARWLHAADVVVALFTGPRVVWKDAVQNKFFDALAAGKPIATNFDGWQSQVAKEAGVGLMLSPLDTREAADQLLSALRDQSWLKAVPERARRLAEGRFNRDRLAAELAALLVRVESSRAEAR